MWPAAEAWATARAVLWAAREMAGTSTTVAPTYSAGSLSSEPATPGCCAAWCALAAASSAPFAAANRFASASPPSCERDTTVKAHGPLIKRTPTLVQRELWGPLLLRGRTVPPWQRLIRVPRGWNMPNVLPGQCERGANCATRLPLYAANDSMRRKYDARFGLPRYVSPIYTLDFERTSCKTLLYAQLLEQDFFFRMLQHDVTAKQIMRRLSRLLTISFLKVFLKFKFCF